MNKILLLFFTIFLSFNTYKSNAQGNYWVEFSDKNNSKYSLSTPENYLSERAIERRIKQNIPIDSLDLPVNSNYIDSVLELNAVLVHKSKWLNGITIFTELDNFQDEVLKLTFVKNVQKSKPLETTKSTINKFKEIASLEKEPIDSTLYGASVYQTGLMNGQFLHNEGFNGEGMQIAILDGGFLNADIYFAFDSLWANNQIRGTKDFVDPNSDFFTTNYHGMSVLSCMGGNVPGELIGTARKASYWLIRSEDTGSEYIIEEDNWVAAAEFADSVGADIINTSLGYYEFDDPTTNHTYADMDGKTTRVTKGANAAASRGMLVFASAGNEGNKPWKFIIAPADGDKVIGVGATNKFGFAAPFTSFGPASDSDIKPNMAAVGWNTYLQKSNGVLGYSNGTSFSSPVLAGMAASLWGAILQDIPDVTAEEIKAVMEFESNLFNEPDSLLGYGIPDFHKAWLYIVNFHSAQDNSENPEWLLFPNPVRDFLTLQKNGTSDFSTTQIEIYSIDGRLLKRWIKNNQSQIVLSNLDGLPQGVLLLRINSGKNIQTIKLYKIQ